MPFWSLLDTRIAIITVGQVKQHLQSRRIRKEPHASIKEQGIDTAHVGRLQRPVLPVVNLADTAILPGSIVDPVPHAGEVPMAILARRTRSHGKTVSEIAAAIKLATSRINAFAGLLTDDHSGGCAIKNIGYPFYFVGKK